MDWIVFGDDWGRHVSTTQHLILNLPPSDRVVWIDSIGMRSPKLADAKRVVGKVRSILATPPVRDTQIYQGTVGEVRRVAPKIAPWHERGLARAINRRLLRFAIAAEADGFQDPVLLSVNPVAIDYLDEIEHSALVYLRLDRYADYPGVDARLVHATEPKIIARADIVAATARSLLPEESRQSLYLPQGVRFEHFAQVDLAPPGTRTLGFYGLLSRYIDFGLVEAVARARPAWRLEFIGRPQVDIPASVTALPNVVIEPPVAFRELPARIASWQAAWAPYVLDEHTRASNPLKLREYLAAGLPAHCTPIPDVVDLPHAFISDDAEAIGAWLDSTSADTRAARAERRGSMQGERWSARAEALRDAVVAL